MLEVKGQLNALGVAQQIKASGGGSASQDYSTTEHVVGKWIDGETDVYERTIVYETPLALTANDWVDTGLTSADNIDTIIEINAVGSNKGNVTPLECVPGADSKYLAIMLCANLSNRDIKYLTLRYLKGLS